MICRNKIAKSLTTPANQRIEKEQKPVNGELLWCELETKGMKKEKVFTLHRIFS